MLFCPALLGVVRLGKDFKNTVGLGIVLQCIVWQGCEIKVSSCIARCTAVGCCVVRYGEEIMYKLKRNDKVLREIQGKYGNAEIISISIQFTEDFKTKENDKFFILKVPKCEGLEIIWRKGD